MITMNPLQKWRYLIVLAEDCVTLDQLNRLGADGWELVTINHVGNFIFKRPLPVA